MTEEVDDKDEGLKSLHPNVIKTAQDFEVEMQSVSTAKQFVCYRGAQVFSYLLRFQKAEEKTLFKYYGDNKDFIFDFCTNLTKLINDGFKRCEEGLWKDEDTKRTSYSVVKGLLCDDKLILAY